MNGRSWPVCDRRVVGRDQPGEITLQFAPRSPARRFPGAPVDQRRFGAPHSICQCHATPRTPGIGDHSGLVVDWPAAIVTCQTFKERRQDEIRYQLV